MDRADGTPCSGGALHHGLKSVVTKYFEPMALKRIDMALRRFEQ
jgi:hypothetical protein